MNFYRVLLLVSISICLMNCSDLERRINDFQKQVSDTVEFLSGLEKIDLLQKLSQLQSELQKRELNGDDMSSQKYHELKGTLSMLSFAIDPEGELQNFVVTYKASDSEEKIHSGQAGPSNQLDDFERKINNYIVRNIRMKSILEAIQESNVQILMDQLETIHPTELFESDDQGPIIAQAALYYADTPNGILIRQLVAQKYKEFE